MSKKTLLFIAAVVVMLAGATSAYSYQETWDGWFNSGSLRYSGYTFNYVSGEGMLEDNTFGDKDYFCINTVPVLTFTCTGVGTAKLWVTSCSGYKDTGQEDQKEAKGNPTWSGHGIIDWDSSPDTEFTFVSGTWDTDDVNDYFDYDPETPTYIAEWDITYSYPDGLDGEGGSTGELLE